MPRHDPAGPVFWWCARCDKEIHEVKHPQREAREGSPHQHFHPGCWQRCTKDKHATKGDALASALRSARYENKPLRTYLCPICKYWHLTSRTT